MDKEIQHGQQNDADEIQFYKEAIWALIKNMNDLDVLKCIATYVFRISFRRND